MHELRTSAILVEPDALDDAITTMLPRSELEAALAADEPAQLWLELGQEGADDEWLLEIDLGSAELDELLRRSSGPDVALALDGEALAFLLEDADVEAHGMRSALAIAVGAAAFAAPAGLAATPEAASPAATAQKAQAAAAAATATAQVSNAAASAQVAKLATKAQVSKSLVVKAKGITTLRSGFLR
jgi:hypothetical protein